MLENVITVAVITVTWAIIEYLRGRRMLYPVETPKGSQINRIIAVALFIIAGSLPFFDWWTTLYVAFGVLIWKYAGGGHGKYFSAFLGNYNPYEKEVGWIDRFVNKVIDPRKNTAKWNYARGTLGMSLTGVIVVPLVFMTGGFTLQAALIGLGLGLAKGIIYGVQRYFPPHDDDVADAEPIWGGIVGFTFSVVKTYGFLI